MDALEKLCVACIHRPRSVLASWLLLAAVCGPFGLQLIDHCKFTFEPAPGTETYDAQAAFKREFPASVNQDVEVVLISCAGHCPSGIAALAFANHSVQELRSLCSSLNSSHLGVLHNWTDHFQFSASAPARLGLPSPFLSASNETLLFQLSWTVGDRQREVIAMLNEVRQLVQELHRQGLKEEEPVFVSIAGQLALFTDTLSSTRQDIEKKDIIVMPFALLVLASRVGSLRLMIIPICCLACSLAASLGIFLPFAIYVVDISPLAPSTMAFLGIALAIDYSLFMLTRYAEEVEAGASTEAALRSTLRQSGHVVLISSSVLIICYMGVLFYPSGGIATIGLGASLTVFLCAASNLTLTPCTICAFPGLFGAEAMKRRRDRRSGCRAPCGRACGGCWPAIARAVTTRPGVIVVPLVCLAFLLPACAVLFHYRESFANQLTFPSHSDTSIAYQHLTREFPAGKLSPQYVLLPASNGSVRSDEFFDASCHLAQILLEDLSVPPFNLQSSDLLGPALLPLPAAQEQQGNASGLKCLRWNSTKKDDLHPFGPLTAETLLELPNDLGEAYREQWGKLVSSRSEDTALIAITVPFDPYSDTLWPFVLAARGAIKKATENSEEGQVSENLFLGRRLQDSSKPMLFGTLTVVFDIVEVTYGRIPYIVSGTVFIVFSLIAFAFRAALAPIKMFVTVVVPLVAVFGIAVWVYQDGAFNWLPGGPGNNPFTTPPGGGFYWAAPVFTCTIIIGLALDYDVFLFARVIELRRRGYSNEVAVRGGLCLTGPTITSAGLIMAIAFCGLLLSDVPSNNQIGFVMAFGVLMDTFVIRTCLVPSVLTLASSLNYWPQKMPPVTQFGTEMLLLDPQGQDLAEYPVAQDATPGARGNLEVDNSPVR